MFILFFLWGEEVVEEVLQDMVRQLQVYPFHFGLCQFMFHWRRGSPEAVPEAVFRLLLPCACYLQQYMELMAEGCKWGRYSSMFAYLSEKLAVIIGRSDSPSKAAVTAQQADPDPQESARWTPTRVYNSRISPDE